MTVANPPIYKVKPFAHQEAALNAWKGHKRFALFCEMGTGKTFIAINHAAYLFREEQVGRVLVLAPLSLLGVWEREIEKYCPVSYNMRIIDRPVRWKRYLQFLDIGSTDESRLEFVVINYDSLITKKFPDLVRGQFGFLIMDESTMLKNHNAKRTKKAKALAPGIEHAGILTGNATPNGPLDLFAQFSILDTKILGFTSYYAFRNRYAYMGGYYVGGKPVQVVGYNTKLIESELKPRIAPHVFQISKAECLDLPPKIYQQREVTMSKDQARTYKDLKEQAVAEFKGKELKAPIVIARLMRLSQIAGGFFPDAEDGTKNITFEPNPKIIELGHLLDEIDGKFVVWCRFRAELQAVAAMLSKLKIDHVLFYGDTSAEDRKTAVSRFQEDPKCRVFLGITSCGRFGLTLTAGRTVVYFSNSYSFEDRSQSEDRCHRAGLKHAVTYIDLFAKDTLDQVILAALKAKSDLSEFIKNLKIEDVV